MSDYTPSVKREVRAAGAYRVGQGRGDHEIRYSPVSGRNFVIDGKIKSRHLDWLMSYPGSYFHPLTGDRAGRYSVRLTANVRITFGWDGDGAVDVDIEDYH